MKTFEEVYEELQCKNSSELNNSWEAAKKESKKSKKISIIVCLIIDAVLVTMFLQNSISASWVPLVMSILISNIIVYAIICALFSKNHNEYKTKYKQIVINKLMSNFYNNVEYFPNKSMPEYIYKKADYNEKYDIYESEDYLEANINNKYSIQMAEILTQEEEAYTDSEGDEHTRKITIFNGLFAKVIMDKSITGELRISQNRTVYSKNKLEMDSSEFEKYFDVEASNNIVGMQILTADVMEELIDFQNNANMEYDICIQDNELYLRFHCGEMFEAGKLKDGPIDRDTVKKYFYMLNFTYNLSNKLINIINDTEI